MFASTLRGMVAHKVRLVLTTASIALGVAFLAGTLILTDTMSLAFTQLFGKIGAGTDAVVRTEAAYKQAEGAGLSRAPIAASVLDQVKAVDGVRVAEGSVTGYALLTDTEGKAVLTSGGAPTQGYSMPRDVTLRGDVDRGQRPRAARAARGRHRRHLGREARHPARLGHQHPVPRPDPGVHGRGHRRVRRREEPRRHDLGVLRHRDRAEGARLPRHLRRDQRAGRRRRHRQGARHSGSTQPCRTPRKQSPGRTSPRRTPTRSPRA